MAAYSSGNDNAMDLEALLHANGAPDGGIVLTAGECDFLDELAAASVDAADCSHAAALDGVTSSAALASASVASIDAGQEAASSCQSCANDDRATVVMNQRRLAGQTGLSDARSGYVREGLIGRRLAHSQYAWNYFQ